MEPIIQHSRVHTNISPNEALRQLVQRGPHPANPGMPPEATPAFQQSLAAATPGRGTPGQFQGGPPHPGGPPGAQAFASPAQAAHLNLPNAGSPAAMAMSPAVKGHGLPQGGGGPGPAPPGGAAMVPQASQQGSSSGGGAGGGGSQGTSANTSPHVTNKKRRASAVKVEMDDGPEMNGTKVKASPRMTGGKRQKG